MKIMIFVGWRQWEMGLGTAPRSSRQKTSLLARLCLDGKQLFEELVKVPEGARFN
jgi:hypothetical protein